MRAVVRRQVGLIALMAFLHRRGVRGYVTFNILIFADELAAAEDYLRSMIVAGVDAAIVQDVGICRMIRAIATAPAEDTLNSRIGGKYDLLLPDLTK